MPELPEVETVKKKLLKDIKNKKILNIDIFYGKIIKESNVIQFKKKITDQKINNVLRIGKYLILELDNYKLVIHLRMEGKFFYYEEYPDITKHDHIIFTLSNGENKNTYLMYSDVRKFGTMHIVDNDKMNIFIPITKLGIEPISSDFTTKYLKDIVKTIKKPIKQTLLDQTKVSGLGNIYVDEILFASKINPLISSQKLTTLEVEKIVKNSKKILKKAIENNGTTIRTFSVGKNQHGNFQSEIKVYGRVGKPCKRCGTILEKIKIGGRGTTFCPNCQVKNTRN